MTEIVRRNAAAAAPAGVRRGDRPQIAASVLRRRLLSWYRRERRDLPWRTTRDPYAIWVAEVMLQQTTVAVATGYWRRFLAALPTVDALAQARRERVLSLWSGLGYYQRARNLHLAARRLVAAGRSELPASLEELRELPGIGPYTAAAVASIAFGAAAPVVDGNVRRVLGRLAGIAGDLRRWAAVRRIERLAGAILDPRSPGDSNQALMELGATVCTPRRPDCAHCVWGAWCVARALGDPERFPERPPRRPPVSVLRGAVRVEDQRGRWLLRQTPGGSHNAGLWGLPALELERRSRPGSPPPRWSARLAARLAADFRECCGVELRVGRLLAAARHTITHHRIAVFLADAELTGPPPRGREWRWVSPARAGAGALSGETKKLLAQLTR